MESQPISEFIRRLAVRENNVLTLAGTGPNGTAQYPILRELGRERLSGLDHVNLISASCVSYFMYIAAMEGGLIVEGYRNYEARVRRLHQGGLGRLLKYLLLRQHKKRALFCSEQLRKTLAIFLDQQFLAQPLSHFDDNIRCHSYCRVAGQFVVITPQSHPAMTVEDVCLACCSIPFLHGAFDYAEHCLIDPMFSKQFTQLRRRITQVPANHLYANIKYDGEYRNILFVKNHARRFPVMANFADFFYLCAGIPNRTIARTHLNNLRLAQMA
ncbi:MAG TPA: hypothetical protein VIC26_06865 [Marinagarivorans sp.]